MRGLPPRAATTPIAPTSPRRDLIGRLPTDAPRSAGITWLYSRYEDGHLGAHRTFERATQRANELGISRSESSPPPPSVTSTNSTAVADGSNRCRRCADGHHRRCGRRSRRGRAASARRQRVVIHRGEVYWADLGEARGSRPAKRRPILVIQADNYNDSRLATVLAAVITSNTTVATMPGNVFLSRGNTGLPRDSVVNVTALITLDKRDLDGSCRARAGKSDDRYRSRTPHGLGTVSTGDEAAKAQHPPGSCRAGLG